MAMSSLDRTTVTLIPDKLVMSQDVDMSIFRVIEWTLDVNPANEGVILVFAMKRKITSEMMTTYFPTLLLTTITFATTFFKPFFFEAALSVNLTTMLVMTTIFISKMEGLPPTSDIKMIDIWLVLCQFYPFAEVILLTAMEYFREDQYDGTDLDNDVMSDVPSRGNTKAQRYISSLKTVGETFSEASHCLRLLKLNFSERFVLPTLVAICFMVYFALATFFYFNV